MWASVWGLKVAAMCVHLFTHIRTQHTQAGKNILAFNVTNCVHLLSWKWNSPSPSFTLFIPSLSLYSLFTSLLLFLSLVLHSFLRLLILQCNAISAMTTGKNHATCCYFAYTASPLPLPPFLSALTTSSCHAVCGCNYF